MQEVFSLFKRFLRPFGIVFIFGYQAFGGGYYDATAKISAFYNHGKYDSIYNLCDVVFHRSISKEQLGSFFKDIYSRNGNIKSFDSIGFKLPATAVFKVYFEKGQLELNLSLDEENLISSLFFLPVKVTENQTDTTTVLNKTPIGLPFNSREQWYVFWGGSTLAQNYHNNTPQQKYAYDFIITDEKGLSHFGNGSRNEDYYDYGKKILAAADGEVVEVIDGVLENEPGKMNPFSAIGNAIIIKVGEEEYITYAHLKTYSILVKPGDKVNKGQIIGQCGNSGNSSEPHLHFQMQDAPDIAQGKGIKMRFGKLILYKKMETANMQNYSPVKGDKVSAGE